jgi:hypothetical protein
MDELSRFSDPWDSIGLQTWRRPERSRLLARLKRIRPSPTIPWRRGFLILRELFGEKVERRDPLDVDYCFQRLLVLDWLSGFRALGFFNDAEVREYALLNAPPQDSILGHFWYGLLGGEEPRDIDRMYRRQLAARERCRINRCVLDPYRGDMIAQAARFRGGDE